MLMVTLSLEDEPAAEPVAGPSTASATYKCSNCHYDTNQRAAYQRHTKSFVKCDECQKTFCGQFAKREIARHNKQIHRPTQTHVCDKCGKSFKFACYLKRHREKTSRAWK